MRSPVILSNAPPRLFDSESSKFAIFGLFTIHNPQKTILSLPPSDPPHAHPPGNGKGGPARPGAKRKDNPFPPGRKEMFLTRASCHSRGPRCGTAFRINLQIGRASCRERE